MSEFRTESDSMGDVSIPSWAYWGAQTQRALENFNVSESRIPQQLIHALGMIKKHAALANCESGLMDTPLADAIAKAADEVCRGKWNSHFPLDVFQTGSGTSWNMNMNEVIANRANELLGNPVGKKYPVHPNDHVNHGQSSNDVIPSSIHIACRLALIDLVESMKTLLGAFEQKEEEYKDQLKLGRTHLQDAVPMTLGQEFGGFKHQVKKGIVRITNVFPHLEELALGGTAIGTGINCHPDFARIAIRGIAGETGVPFKQADNLFESISSKDALVELMGALNTFATSLICIANNIRLLASGPRAGFGEITLPSLQPGSSIMPGKINPVIPEMVIQVAAYVNGKTCAVTIGGQHGPLQLNMMHPLIAMETLTSITVLKYTCREFAEKCISGIKANSSRCNELIEWSLALVTPLANKIGYDKAAQLAYTAYKENRTIRDVARESGLVPEEELESLLDPKNMVYPKRENI